MARWQDQVLRGTRAAQPAATLVPIGTLYCVTDENNVLERSNGTTWDSYSPTPGTFPVDVDPAGALDGDGTVGDPLAVRPDNVTIVINGSNQLEAQSAASSAARDTNGFRLTLATGQPIFAPQPATPSATDTTNDIVTFATDPIWYDGTIVTVASTVGGLTAGTRYFLHRISSVTYSFHTTVANAMSGASRVDLTATINVSVIPSGISTTGIYLTPHRSSQIALYDGYDWVLMDLPEMSVGLGTLTSDTNYDVFLDYNGGTPNLYIGAAWTSAILRSVALTRQDGILVSSADAQSRYIGTFRTNSTTTTIDDAGGIASQVGAKRFLWNYANRVRREMVVWDGTASWNYTATAYQQANGAAGNRVECVTGMSEDSVDVVVNVLVIQSGAQPISYGVGQDSTTVNSARTYGHTATSSAASRAAGFYTAMLFGYHALNWIESSVASGTTTWGGTGTTAGGFYRSGLTGTVWC